MKPKCDLTEAKMALVELSLTSVMYGDYLVVLNSDFDLVVAGEPQLALMLLFNIRTGRFMARDSIQLNFNRMFNRVFNRVHYTKYTHFCV